MQVKPLADRVFVRTLEAEDKVGSIIIPDTAKEKPQKGEVIAVGPGKRDKDGTRVKMSVKKGDKVLFGKWSGTEITLEGEELLIVNESDILATL